jgi:CheY-like chemotaxis protein
MANILIVDDEAPLRDMMTQMLQRDGHSTTTACNGIEALQRLQEHSFDLMILDMLMPGKDGIQTTLEARKIFPQLRILAVSGGRRAIPARFNLSSASMLGADASLEKPFDWDALRQAVTTLLARTA